MRHSHVLRIGFVAVLAVIFGPHLTDLIEHTPPVTTGRAIAGPNGPRAMVESALDASSAQGGPGQSLERFSSHLAGPGSLPMQMVDGVMKLASGPAVQGPLRAVFTSAGRLGLHAPARP